MTTMVAVDLGAQSGRVALGRFDGERLSVTEAHRFPNVPVTTRGVLQWDVLRLFGDVLTGLHAAAREGPVDSVGVDSWAIDFGLLDGSGRLLRNPVHYRDGRRAAAQAGVLALVPGRELYERTGIQLLPINTVNELAAMAAEADPVLEIAETLLLIPDLMHFWLGGSPSPSGRTRPRHSASTSTREPGPPTCSDGSASRAGSSRRSSLRGRRSGLWTPGSPRRPASRARP